MVSDLPNPFAVNVVSDGASISVLLHGELDIATEDDVASTFAQVLDGRPASLIVDLRNLVFLDSTGLRALLRLRESCSAAGCSLQLVRGTAGVQRVFEVSGVAAHFSMIDEPSLRVAA